MADTRLGCIGSVLRDHREKAHVSLRQLSKLSDCNAGELSKFENGLVAVELSVIRMYAKECGGEPRLLLDRCLREVRKQFETLS